ncbi:hypothetical protein HYU11_00265 [Candidatus Woesearchaeota archaeon]|nr:hypothetical protein [Candidatus Woesearchaeota archaeon]
MAINQLYSGILSYVLPVNIRAISTRVEWPEDTITEIAELDVYTALNMAYSASRIAGRIIEVGCGTAIPSIFASYLTGEALATDPKEKAVRVANIISRTFQSRTSFLNADLDEIVRWGLVNTGTTLIADKPSGFEDEVVNAAIRTRCSLVYSPPIRWKNIAYKSARKQELLHVRADLSEKGEKLINAGFNVSTYILGDSMPRGILAASLTPNDQSVESIQLTRGYLAR